MRAHSPEAVSFIVGLAERSASRNSKSRIAFQATASGGDRFAVVLEFEFISRIIAPKHSMKCWRRPRRDCRPRAAIRSPRHNSEVAPPLIRHAPHDTFSPRSGEKGAPIACLPRPPLLPPAQSRSPFKRMAQRMARQFIYHMQGLTKTWPGGKKVLENIHLSFYPDAKIGVLGVNGSGKSTLLRIMAGIDTEFVGEGFIAEGARVGYLPQEPHLDPDLDVRGNVMLGVAAKQAILDRYNELAMNYSDETADEMTRLQDEIEAQGPVGPRQPGRTGDGGARLPARRGRRRHAVGRRAPPRRTVPAAARKAGNAAARRADQPSRRRDGELARRASAPLSRRHPDRHPRPLFPRQCDGLDSRARSRPRHSLRGQLFVLAEAEAEAAAAGGTRGGSAPARAGGRERMDRLLAQGPAGQIQGAHPGL